MPSFQAPVQAASKACLTRRRSDHGGERAQLSSLGIVAAFERKLEQQLSRRPPKRTGSRNISSCQTPLLVWVRIGGRPIGGAIIQHLPIRISNPSHTPKVAAVLGGKHRNRNYVPDSYRILI